MTQKELSNLAHVKQGKISDYERRKRNIEYEPLSVASRIAAALGVSVEDLIEQELNK